MFTSRAEYRLLLRQDNADLRLTPASHAFGLASNERMFHVEQKRQNIDKIVSFFTNTKMEPGETNDYLVSRGTSVLNERTNLYSILSRPQSNIDSMKEGIPMLNNFISEFSQETIEEAEILMKYEGYIRKEEESVMKMERMEHLAIAPHFDFTKINSLSVEAKQKLTKIKPGTIGQASRISGVSPSDISVLLVYLGR